MDDEPMWAAGHVVAPTPGSAITIPETANEFAIKGNHLTLVKGNLFDGRTKTNPHKHIHEFLRICDMFKYKDTKNEAVRLMMFPLSLTGEAKTWLDELNEGTSNMELFSVSLADLGASIDFMPILYIAKYLSTYKTTKMSIRLADRSFQYPVGIAENMLVEVGKFTFPADFVILKMEEDSKVPLILGRPFLHTADAVIRVKQK
ncbi:reverse transcriptase domain-containing protein [Tanacetum coccineum]